MIKPIVNVAEVDLVPRGLEFAPKGASAELYDLKMARISAPLGASKLGYNVTAYAPGKRAFPMHNHRVNEEMFFVLQGTGEMRICGETYPLRSGDVVACPAGGPETAHQIINSGTEALRYLAVSTRLQPEICEYPESGKFGVYGEFGDEASSQRKLYRYLGREAPGVDYWDGE